MKLLHDLIQKLSVCNVCKLCENRTQVVVSRGNPLAKAIILAEAPGASEDQEGRPLVGPSGKLLHALFLKYANLDTNKDFYITNTVLCRPPNNRNPEQEEIDACKPNWLAQLELIKPNFIVAVGNIPLHALTNKTGITKHRGKWLDYKDIKVLPIYHPSYLLRAESDELYDTTIRDIQTIKKALVEEVYSDTD